ncbi:ADP-ribosylglycohydrolase family protein [Cryobacterium sp. AP23]
MTLTTAQTDRAAGVLLGMACGDALGAGYEFGPPLPEDTDVAMKGGGQFDWAPGEWTDDTSMAVPIARAIAAGRDLADDRVLDDIVAAWVDWARTAPDVGIQLRAVLGSAVPTAAGVRAAAQAHHDRNGRSAGNGSLMRTAPVALAYLDDPAGLAAAARAISDLTHVEADAGDACVLWCLAIRHAVLEAELDLRVGLAALPAERRERWAGLIAAAELHPPAYFDQNGWVVQALQGAWSAISRAPSTDARQLRLALEGAVRGGRDTDTVAAIAGGLVGAQWGASAVPAEWLRIVHGWPGLSGEDLVALGIEGALAGSRHAQHGAGQARPVRGSVPEDHHGVAPGGLEAAIALATAAHAGQVDKLGVAYIEHPLGVMAKVDGADEKIVAVLHDVVEDTEVTLDDLRAQGFAEHIVRAVDAVTKRPGEPLAASMARVAADPLAMTVKFADLAHNANPDRQAELPPETRERLMAKYQESARLLGTTLDEILA